MIGQVFGYHVLRTWEWEPSFPVRSILPPLVTTWIPFLLAKTFLRGMDLPTNPEITWLSRTRAVNSTYGTLPYWALIILCDIFAPGSVNQQIRSENSWNERSIYRLCGICSRQQPNIAHFGSDFIGIVACHAYTPSAAIFEFDRVSLGCFVVCCIPLVRGRMPSESSQDTIIEGEAVIILLFNHN